MLLFCHVNNGYEFQAFIKDKVYKLIIVICF